MKIKDNVINELFEELKTKSDYKNRVQKLKNLTKKINLKKRYSNYTCKIWYFIYNNTSKSSRSTCSYLY